LGGTVTILELRRISKELGYNKSEQELQDMFKKVDKDRDGLLKV
jgi:Ca2+-binding EF-hand superfamily protein